MSLFTNQKQTADAIRRNRLALLPGYSSAFASLDDAFLFGQVLAAEKALEHSLRVFFTQTEVLPDMATQAERDALDAAGTRWEEEPAYDMDPDFFGGNSWGFLLLNYVPVIEVHSIRFYYPQPFTAIWDIPTDWIRLDRKHGHLRLVPASNFAAAPMNAWVMSVVGGGRTVPHMIQVRYSAGIKDAKTEYPDLVDLILRASVLRILLGGMIPQSGSISADGLSRSVSLDLQKHKELLDDDVNSLRSVLHGVRVVVV